MFKDTFWQILALPMPANHYFIIILILTTKFQVTLMHFFIVYFSMGEGRDCLHIMVP